MINYVHPDYPGLDCVYCGELAGTKDHLLPRNFTGESDRLRVPVVPSCQECNSILSESYMPDVLERREYVQNRLRIKYKKYLRVIQWGESDLAEFGDQLRSVILSQMEQHDRIVRRLAWPEKPTYDYDAWAGAWEEPLSVHDGDLKTLPRPLQGLFGVLQGYDQDMEKDPPIH